MCRKIFTCRYAHIQHNMIHIRKKSFTCEVCQKTFTRKHNLKDHHNRIHIVGRPFACVVCQKTFKSKQYLFAHRILHDKRFSCDVCQKIFREKKNLNIHMQIHNDVKAYSCEVCSKNFTRKDTFSRHMVLHTGEGGFSCHVCLRTLSTKFHLSTHMRIHTGEKPFSCEVCHKGFRLKQTLCRHKRFHFKEIYQKIWPQGSPRRVHTGEECFTCDVCQMNFTVKASLTRHMRIHGDDEPHFGSGCQDSSKFKCFQHVQQRVKLFSCGTCQKSFASKQSFKLHEQLHNDQKTLSCKICQKILPKARKLSQYRSFVNTGESTVCLDCITPQKDIATRIIIDASVIKESLTAHEKIHTGQNLCSWDVFQKTMGKSSMCHDSITSQKDIATRISADGSQNSLKTSKEIMSNCDACNKSFWLKSDLSVHMEMHMDCERFTCKICQKSFIMKGSLVRHMTQHTSESKDDKDIYREDENQENNCSCFICHKLTSLCWFLVEDDVGVVLCDQCERSSLVCLLCDQNVPISELRIHIGSHTGDLMYYT